MTITSGFSWNFPPELLALPRLGAVNGHPSLLPRYRGPNPLFWHFMNNEAQGGLTMHRMDAVFDTGNILVQRAIEIAPDDDIDSFFPKLLAAGGPMIPEMLQPLPLAYPAHLSQSKGPATRPFVPMSNAGWIGLIPPGNCATRFATGAARAPWQQLKAKHTLCVALMSLLPPQ